jgi:toluene monooxygenase electron transfer component
VRIQLNARNRAYQFEVEQGARMLYAGLAAGISLPYECGSGTCGTCKARSLRATSTTCGHRPRDKNI